MNESLTLAKYICNTSYDDLPSDVVWATKRSFLDGLGVMLAASGAGEGVGEVVNLAIRMGGVRESTIIGTNTMVPAYMAAFANGAMSHAMDFEDYGMRVHPNAAAIPAALAVAEYVGNISGKEFISALALGCDVTCRLSMAREQDCDPLDAGWYMPPILGAFGAASASSKLLGLGPEEVVDAFSLTLCQATCSAQLIHSAHSVVRAIRDAFSAKSGVFSALLAKNGLKGFDEPIEGKAGLFTMYSGGRYDPRVLTDGLGKNFGGVNISLKPWPACAITHPYIEAALQIAHQWKMEPVEMERVRLVVGDGPETRMVCEPLERKRRPTVAIDAKFSIPFVVATALIYGSVTLDHFSKEALADGNILSLTGKMSLDVVPELSNNETGQGLVQVWARGRKIESQKVAFTYGHPNNPMTEADVVSKFMNCAKYASKRVSAGVLNELLRMILHLEEVADMRKVAALL
jgi:2-methylcitrate dehydratase PrpD